MKQQTHRVYENMALLALDLFARIIAMRINAGPPFSALFTLWLSMMAAVGLASRAAFSRHSTFGVRTDEGINPLPGSVGDYFWGGVFGTYFWIDPKEKLFAVLMMQSPQARPQYRNLMRELVYQAITD
jgi:CubicO group peptidase (beta-lactamase class C family)